MDLQDLISSLDYETVLKDVSEAGKSWWEENQSLVQEVGKEGVQAAFTIAALKKFPEVILDPDMNIKKMEAVAKLSELSAEHQEKLNEIIPSIMETIGSVLKKAASRFASVALKAALFAMV